LLAVAVALTLHYNASRTIVGCTLRIYWRLNELNNGDLVGKHKKEVVKLHGIEQVKRWRRSYDEAPPPMQDDHPYHPARDPKYRLMLPKIPKFESLYCTMKWSSVCWEDKIAPQSCDGKTVGHENNLRSLHKVLLIYRYLMWFPWHVD